MYPVSRRPSISMQRPLSPAQASPEHVQVQELCAQVTVLTRQAIPAALWWASGPSSVRFPVDYKLLVIPPGATGCILKAQTQCSWGPAFGALMLWATMGSLPETFSSWTATPSAHSPETWGFCSFCCLDFGLELLPHSPCTPPPDPCPIFLVSNLKVHF